MTGRERRMAVVLGGALGILVVYNTCKRLLIVPRTEAIADIERYRGENERLDMLLRSERPLAVRWTTAAERTFSRDENELANRFGQSLKQLAEAHRLDRLTLNRRRGGDIAVGKKKSDVRAFSYTINAEAAYDDVVGFLRELYQAPYVAQVTKLSLSPVESRTVRNRVRIDEMEIDTLIMPAVDPKTSAAAASARAMDKLPDPPIDPLRSDTAGDEAFALLADRNIFRQYMPPPPNMLVIDNQDWREVTVQLTYYWDDRVREQPYTTVPSKTKRDGIEGLGDVLEAMAVYPDGTRHGPNRFDAAVGQPWVFVIPVHSPAPPPESVDLAIDNRHNEDVDVTIVLTTKDGNRITQPTMRIPGTKKQDVYPAFVVQSLTATATYPSGKQAASVTLTPKAGKQMFVVPRESSGAPVVVAEASVDDPPANPNLVVTGLLTYPGTHEMIALDGQSKKRVVYQAGPGAADPGPDIDGGALVAVHPIGGIVRMPSGSFYLYPCGLPFTQRVKLEAQSEGDLEAAISAWAGR